MELKKNAAAKQKIATRSSALAGIKREVIGAKLKKKKALMVRNENIDPRIFSSSAPGSEIIWVVVSVKPKSTRMAKTEA